MSNIKSNKIKVFPSVGRAEDYESSYLTTEENLTKTLTSINTQNNTSWVFSKDGEKPFKVILHGYCFEIDDDLPDTCYATIYINNNLWSGDFQRLVNSDGTKPLDVNNEFTALTISETEPEKVSGDIESFSLKLKENGIIPNSSKLSYLASNILDDTTGEFIKTSFETEKLKVNNEFIANNLTAEDITTKKLTVNEKATITVGDIVNVNSTDIHTTDLTSIGSINGNAITSKKIDSDNWEIDELTSPLAKITQGNITNITSDAIWTKILNSTEKVTSKAIETTTLTVDSWTVKSLTSPKATITDLEVTNNLTSKAWTITTLNSTTSTITTGNITTLNTTTGNIDNITSTGTIKGNSVSASILSATTGTITTLKSTTGTITNITSTGTIEWNKITSSDITSTTGTITTLKSTTGNITTGNITNLTVTGTLTPPTNFYGKYTITYDGKTLNIKENY